MAYKIDPKHHNIYENDINDLNDVQNELSMLSTDMDILAWGCGELFHHAFRNTASNEFVGQFPAIVFSMMAERTARLNKQVQELRHGKPATGSEA